MGEIAHLPGREGTAEAPSDTIQRAAKMGRVALLEALRDKVAAALDRGVAARDLASLTRRLQELEKDIAAARAGGKGDKVGQATKKPDEPLY